MHQMRVGVVCGSIRIPRLNSDAHAMAGPHARLVMVSACMSTLHLFY
jgi:hypothetical protein